ncbi:MAG: type II toxin-antitoxin system death-on-curing family toxin [Anaerostipes caccae]|uniref:type II toxin-antitoxin system death-on-curing family toxin n=1 Tax=Anaerostipes caccae TaxID=105841 RepID=UPI002D8051CE|nr:type II toxin-antitoxin system death-on-curing family toxin [Anaerostipes caccae]
MKNHAFIDGNERIGAHATLVFLALNRIELKYTQEELSDTILIIASKELSFEEFYNGY